MLRDMREQVAHRNPTLAVLSEFPRAGHRRAVVVELSRLDFHFEWLTVLFFQKRLGIPGIDLGRATVHVEIDDSFHFGWKVSRTACQSASVIAIAFAIIGHARVSRVRHQAGERYASKPTSRIAKHFTTGGSSRSEVAAMMRHRRIGVEF